MAFLTGIGSVGKPIMIVPGIMKRGRDNALLRRIIFADGNANLETVLTAGGECFTVRKYHEGSHDYEEKEIVLGQYAGAFDVLLQITRSPLKSTFKALKSSKRNLKKTGYYFDNAWFESLKQHYPDLTWDTEGVIIFYEILKVNDVPVLSINTQPQNS